MSGSNCCFLNCIQVSHEAGKLKLLSCVWLFATPWTVAHQAPPSMGFSRQEYWSGLPFPSRWSGISISKNLQQFVVIHTVKGFIVVNEAEVDVFLEFSYFFYEKFSDRCWQFDLWFLCLFWIQLEHLKVLGSCTVQDWLGEFWAWPC